MKPQKNTQKPDNLPFTELLDRALCRDKSGDFVVPAPDVKAKLTAEIEKKTGIKARNLPGNLGMCELRRWVSAEPKKFINQTLDVLSDISILLEHQGAEAFEIAFHNTKDISNRWGDKILFAVRYCRAT
jgi:hypothetical protein